MIDKVKTRVKIKETYLSLLCNESLRRRKKIHSKREPPELQLAPDPCEPSIGTASENGGKQPKVAAILMS